MAHRPVPLTRRGPRPARPADLGFTVDEAEVIYWGTCAACRGEESAAGEGTAEADPTTYPTTAQHHTTKEKP